MKDTRNLYTNSLNKEHESARLSAQAILLFEAQKPFLNGLRVELGERLQSRAERPRGRLLDLGAGNGTLTMLLAGFFQDLEIHALEPDEELLQQARANHGNRPIHWKQGTVEAAPYPDDYFDFINVSYVFIHLGNPRGAMAECARMLSPEGRLYLVNPDDARVEGSAAVVDLFKAHAAVYEGDRYIVDKLPGMCDALRLLTRTEIIVTQAAPGVDSPVFKYPEVQLPAPLLQRMLAYMGERKEPEVREAYARLQAEFAAGEARIRGGIDLQVYGKAPL